MKSMVIAGASDLLELIALRGQGVVEMQRNEATLLVQRVYAMWTVLSGGILH
jgi:hypothetical protein